MAFLLLLNGPKYSGALLGGCLGQKSSLDTRRRHPVQLNKSYKSYEIQLFNGYPSKTIENI